ncbi:MAG: carboxypeptidase-like regulatory domain-containing protein, partial [Bacteroidales bacterium]|nr:carboxypeptidase-like regulatory domain-containing protein [Bacteroidales bacterium]
ICFLQTSLVIPQALGQGKEKQKIVNLFGRTLTDSLQPVPYVHIILKNKNLATASDLQGYFSLPAEVNDTLVFRAIGYKLYSMVVKDTFSVKYPTIKIIMIQDTLQLKELVIRPWQGNYERFKQAVLSYKLPITDLDRAYKNLEMMDIQKILYNSPPTPSIAFKNTMKLYNDRLYWAGQLPPVNITNPIAWAQFFKALKNGDLKIH